MNGFAVKKEFIAIGVSMHYQMIVIGVSAGGLNALATILPNLSQNFPIPILIVQHVQEGTDNFLVDYLDGLCQLKVVEATDKMAIRKGYIYIAPPGYHLLVEDQHTIALSQNHKLNFSRPSIDILFESAADVFKNHLIGIVLTGANNDGEKGAQYIKSLGGYIITQSVSTAEAKTMPAATIKSVKVDQVLNLKDIAPYLNAMIVSHEEL